MLLEIENLRIEYGGASGSVRALDGVSLAVESGEVAAIVGASGSGKSTLAHAIAGLLPASARVTGGAIRWRTDPERQAIELTGLSEPAMRAIRGGQIATVFQSPGVALNPVMTVGAQIDEGLRLNRKLSRAGRAAEVVRLLADVELEPDQGWAFPHELSGGMQQRVLIAIALAGQPRLLLADEPTSALDVTVQAQILGLLTRLQRRAGLGMLLITHDIAVAAQMAGRIHVMAEGRVIESGPTRRMLDEPENPLTRDLIRDARSLLSGAMAS